MPIHSDTRGETSPLNGALPLTAEIFVVSRSDRPGWKVYIIRCSDNSLYTGITTDIERRFRQHAGGQGARYFRGRQPIEVVYHENYHSRSSASCREAAIKKMPRADKELLAAEYATERSS